MNWSRAKTILILCFLAGNLLLGYQFLTEIRPADGVINSDRPGLQVSFEEKLWDVGIELGTEMPEGTPRLAPLELLKGEPDLERLLPVLFEDEDLTPITIGGLPAGFRSESAILLRSTEGTIRYQRLDGEMENNVTEAIAVARAHELLAYLGRQPEEMIQDWTSQLEEGRRIVRFLEHHDGRPLFSGGMGMTVDDEGILEFNFLPLQARERSEEVRAVLPAKQVTTANLSRIGQLAPEEASLVEVTLGYFGDVAEGTTTVEPAWRLRFHDDTFIIINAFSGVIKWPA